MRSEGKKRADLAGGAGGATTNHQLPITNYQLPITNSEDRYENCLHN
ncbi:MULTISPECIES: hypothetical protein [Chroococcidiopsis]|nr:MULTISPECIES: hypothetical protein [Chroococcidiopsis]URD49369.1 hypothetical protein M5J74_23980 [Chroococcidiopsis sp. CCNUC1]